MSNGSCNQATKRNKRTAPPPPPPKGYIRRVHRARVREKNWIGAHSRAEPLATMSIHRSDYDVVVTHAVEAFPKLKEWLLALPKVGGIVVAMKGSGYEQEV